MKQRRASGICCTIGLQALYVYTVRVIDDRTAMARPGQVCNLIYHLMYGAIRKSTTLLFALIVISDAEASRIAFFTLSDFTLQSSACTVGGLVKVPYTYNVLDLFYCCQARAVRRLLAHRLAPEDASAAKQEWLEIVEGDGALWAGVSEPYKHTIRAFLVYFQTSLLRHATERFNFRNGSVGARLSPRSQRCFPHHRHALLPPVKRT